MATMTAMTEDEARRISTSWVAAWNRGDLEAIVAHYAESIVLTSPLVARRFARADGTLRGLAELREYVAVGLHGAPDLRIEPRATLIGVDGVTVLYARESGALVAEVLRFDAAGKVRRSYVFYHGQHLAEWPTD
jgi:SnoaL-like domain